MVVYTRAEKEKKGERGMSCGAEPCMQPIILSVLLSFSPIGQFKVLPTSSYLTGTKRVLHVFFSL